MVCVWFLDSIFNRLAGFCKLAGTGNSTTLLLLNFVNLVRQYKNVFHGVSFLVISVGKYKQRVFKFRDSNILSSEFLKISR